MKIVGIAAGGVTVAGALAYRHAKERASEYYRKFVELPDEGELGPVSDQVLSALMATTTALLVEGIDPNRYEDFFRWHAENARGYRRIYERFAASIDDAAGAKGFVAADRATQKKVLDKIADVRRTINANDRTGALMLALFDREWLLYERYVVREILTLFGRTDAWVLSGYGPPPGVPRGLAMYKQPPEQR